MCIRDRNGIVAFCWHWKVPVDMSDKSVKGTAFYSDEIRDFSLEKAVTPGTDEYKVIIKDIDTIALYLPVSYTHLDVYKRQVCD